MPDVSADSSPGHQVRTSCRFASTRETERSTTEGYEVSLSWEERLSIDPLPVRPWPCTLPLGVVAHRDGIPILSGASSWSKEPINQLLQSNGTLGRRFWRYRAVVFNVIAEPGARIRCRHILFSRRRGGDARFHHALLVARGLAPAAAAS